MSKITFRQVKKDEYDPCLEVTFSAFKDYPIYQIYQPKKNINEFNKSVMGCQLYEGLVKDAVFVAERDNEILSVAIVQSPKRRESSLPEYFLYGGLSIVRYGGIRTSFNFLSMADHFNEPNKEFAKKNPNTWNLECLSVNGNCQGQGIGSRIINECVVPYVKRNGGDYLTLITNKEKNVHFYEKNGFEILQHDEFVYNNKKINNWNFVRNLKN